MDRGPDLSQTTHAGDAGQVPPSAFAHGAAATAGAPPREPAVGGVSLRAKAFVALCVLVAFVVAAGGYIAYERMRLQEAFSYAQSLDRDAELAVRAKTQAANALMRVNAQLYTFDETTGTNALAPDLEALGKAIEAMAASEPALVAGRRALEEISVELGRTPTRARVVEVREILRDMERQVARASDAIQDRRAAAAQDYFQRFNRLSLNSVLFAAFGLAAFGLAVTLFFARLARDIRRLESRSQEIVEGWRGAPLPVERSDEVGSLTRAVNRMAEELQKRERQIALAQQEHFHHEKMAAIGTLAAGIAHEIGNPIAAISGVAQSILDVKHDQSCPNRGVNCHPELILEHTQRVSAITRQIAEFTSPRSAEVGLLDLNSLVESTANFVRYDRRFREIQLELRLDRQLPAVQGIADHVVQVLMNLMINAADALEGAAGRVPRIEVSSGVESTFGFVCVADNGCGMDDATRARAFDTFFTTKPPGRGSGLGLAMSRALADQVGGRLDLASGLGVGTRATLLLPLSVVSQEIVRLRREERG